MRQGAGGSRAIVVVGVALVVVALAVGAYLVGAGWSPAGPTPVDTSPPVSGSGADSPVAAAADPVGSAAAWLRGYRDQSWTDPTPSSWTTRVAPVVTGTLAADYRAAQGADGGQEWRDYVARRCETTVTTPGGVIPAEAPHTADQVWVQVSGDAITHCAAGPAPGEADEHLAATVQLVRGPDGLWRVASRLF